VQEFLLKSRYRFTEFFHKTVQVYHDFQERKKPEWLHPGDIKDFPVLELCSDAFRESLELFDRDGGHGFLKGNHPQHPFIVKHIVHRNEDAIFPIEDEQAEKCHFLTFLDARDKPVSFPASSYAKQSSVGYSLAFRPDRYRVESGKNPFVDTVFER
jgi:hypothetical protein